MAPIVNLDAFKSTEPQPQWLNQLRVTIAMGKRYEQRGETEKAKDCYLTVLYYYPEDTRTRLRLGKCYQKLFEPEKAMEHQIHAMRTDPNSFRTAENGASMDLDAGNLESSFTSYIQLYKKSKTSHECNRQLLKVKNVMEKSLPANGIMVCLKNTMLKMIENQQFLNNSTICPVSSVRRNNAHSKRYEAYYLRHLTTDLEFYRKQLNVLPKSNKHDKAIYNQFQEIVKSFEKVKVDISRQNPIHVIECQRTNRQFVNRKSVEDMKTKQISNYINIIVEHSLAGEIRLAQRQAELAVEFMEKNQCKSLDVVNSLYEVLGLALYLLNQNISKWSEELNEKRILFILGSIIDEDDPYYNVCYKSYFGFYCSYTRRNLEKLTNRLKDNELSTYSLYLQYERIKYYLKLKQFFRTISLSKKMYDDANALGSIAWQVNALMMAAISESRLGNSMNCMKILEVVIPLSRTLGNDEVTQFLSKIWKQFSEEKVRVHKEGPKEKRKADLVDIMPDLESARLMKTVLSHMDKLPTECRLPLLLSEPVKNDCKATRRDDRCNYENFLRDAARLHETLK